jgi:hypothetical protein
MQAAEPDCTAHRVKHAPDGTAWLVYGCDDSLPCGHSQILKVTHHTEGSKAVQTCTATHTIVQFAQHNYSVDVTAVTVAAVTAACDNLMNLHTALGLHDVRYLEADTSKQNWFQARRNGEGDSNGVQAISLGRCQLRIGIPTIKAKAATGHRR